MTEVYDVIIVGGGPTGVALGIELGLNNVKTLILEKHETPLLSPRAQSLNERSMELFMRWGIAEKLQSHILLPQDYPMRGVWCSKLNGTTYATAGSQDKLNTQLTPQKAIRIPLYITENMLRERLQAFECITLLKNQQVESVVIDNESTTVIAKNKTDQSTNHYSAKYVIGCDGAKSIVRQCAAIHFEALAPKRQVINVLFESAELDKKITVEKGFIYYIMENKIPAVIGPVDLTKGLWYAQIFYSGDETDIEKINTSDLLNEITGLTFNKKILNAHFWDMQIELANHYSKDNRLFLVGDAAHAFAPTGGFGLNTGLGDVTNLAWKLASVIQQKSSDKILNTYESERRPVALRNLQAAEKNASDALAVRTQFPPEKDPKKFADENARLAKQHSHSSGIALGYSYNPHEKPMSQSEYIPTAKPGYFLPHIMISEKPIYEKLSPTHWTLIVCGKEKIKFQLDKLKILHAPEDAYPVRYILIRPDWHIALATNTISESILKNYFDGVFKAGDFN